jgi:hypothetical protein
MGYMIYCKDVAEEEVLQMIIEQNDKEAEQDDEKAEKNEENGKKKN